MELNPNWLKSARPANVEDLAEIPDESIMTQPDTVRELYQNRKIEVWYLAESNAAIKIVHANYLKSGCLKHPTGGLLVAGNTILGQGTNAGRRWESCARVYLRSQTGQGYENCRRLDTCAQVEHSEVTCIQNAIAQINPSSGQEIMRAMQEVNEAISRNDQAAMKAGYLRRNALIAQSAGLLQPRPLAVALYGHWWACQSCTSAMLAAGVERLYLLEGARRFFDPQSPDSRIPKLDPITGKEKK